jgi:hypothetical protein
MDYYVFWDSATHRITPIEYDGNSAFNSVAANWSPFLKENNVQYPIMNRLFPIPVFRQRYLAHVRTMLEETLTPSYFNPKIDSFYNLIDTFVQSDPKKGVTYFQFQNDRNAIRTWLSNRRATYMGNTEVIRAYPDIDNVAHTSNGQINQAPTATQEPTITANITFASGLNAVNLYYSTGLDGYFDKTTMKDDGLSGDGAARDGVFGGKLPSFGHGTYVRYYIEAVANDPWKTVAYMPKGAEHDVYFYQVKLNKSNITSVAINEIMADNKTTVTDPSAQYEDWIELHNKTNALVDIGGFYLSDDVTHRSKWKFPAGTTIPANGYLIVWADEDASQLGFHANFKLSASGETVIFSDRDSAVIDQVIFGYQVADKGYARRPNGTGDFVIQNPTFNQNNNFTTATNDFLTDNAVKMYPNPTKEGVFIEVNQKQQQDVQITNMLGQVLLKTQFSEKIYVPTEGWQSGMYVVKIGNIVKSLSVIR